MNIVEMPLPHFTEGRVSPVEVLLVHYTAGDTLSGAFNAMKTRGVSANYTVDRDGAKIRHVAEANRAWHAGYSSWLGRSAVNNFSLGIESVNFGYGLVGGGRLYRTEKKPDGSSARVYSKYPFEKPIDHRASCSKWSWASLPEIQRESLFELILDIVWRHVTILSENVVGHEHVSPGLKLDPGPAYREFWIELDRRMDQVFAGTPKVKDPSWKRETRVKCLQSHIVRLGLDIGEIDGDWGKKTQAGLEKAWSMYAGTYELNKAYPGVAPAQEHLIGLCRAMRLIPGFDT